jgi:putative flippase GtrA
MTMQDESLATAASRAREGTTARSGSSEVGPRPRSSGSRSGATSRTARPIPRVHTRVRHGMRRGHNWIQLVKFCLVGASGYVVNLTVFALAVEVFGLHHLIGATAAFVVAVTNNFAWNRHWTFRARGGHAGFQAARFFAVSVAAFLVAAVILEVLVTGFGVPEVVAQAVSVVMATPLNFIGNKMWSFGARPARA